jgi:hypothetical protein
MRSLALAARTSLTVATPHAHASSSDSSDSRVLGETLSLARPIDPLARDPARASRTSIDARRVASAFAIDARAFDVTHTASIARFSRLLFLDRVVADENACTRVATASNHAKITVAPVTMRYGTNHFAVGDRGAIRSRAAEHFRVFENSIRHALVRVSDSAGRPLRSTAPIRSDA